MRHARAELSHTRTNVILAALFLAMFVLGTAELLVVGGINLIASSLQVSIPAAGTLVTANALGLAIGVPILTALTIKLNKRTILIGTLSLFGLTNLVLVLTTNYALFVVMRAVAGALQGLFIGVAFGVAMAIVPPERIGRAISVVISGVAVSAALGVPLGTLVGQALGWRGSFTAVVVFAVTALLAIVAVAPSVPGAGGGATGQARYAFAPRVLAVLGLNFLTFAAVYAALTYIVPFLQRVTGISGPLISVFLLAYGVATAVGSFGGGRFADISAARTLIVATCGLALSFLQYRVVSLAGPGGQLASSLPASAINLGIAFGAFIGGVAIDNFDASAPVISGLIVALISIAVAWATSFLGPPAAKAASPQANAPRPVASAA